MMTDASTTTTELATAAEAALPQEPALSREEREASDRAYVKAVTRTSDGVVFIPCVVAGNDEDDSGTGVLTGCVCFVVKGKYLLSLPG